MLFQDSITDKIVSERDTLKHSWNTSTSILSVEELIKIGLSKPEAERFLDFYRLYLNRKRYHSHIDHLKPPEQDFFIDYEKLPDLPEDKKQGFLQKVIVIKFNGGLGTKMGLEIPKSTIELRNDLSFLDISVKQIEILNDTYHVDIPLVLMNSAWTDAETKKVIEI